jgi:cephalosporin hydroxylase
MKLTIDTESRLLTTASEGRERVFPLYSREAFELVSREWVRIGWGVDYYFTMTWFGRLIQQLPEDLVRIQEVIASLKPDVIIETGIYFGGSLLFHATLCEGLGKGRVIGIDQYIHTDTRAAIAQNRLAHRIEMVEGDSAGPATLKTVNSMLRQGESVLVVLDSDHSKAHVAQELAAYAPLVTPGSWIVVTDGIMRDLTDVPGGKAEWAQDNPCSAAAEFLAGNPQFESGQPEWPFNKSSLRQNITYWPDGWLRRKA